MVQFHVGLLVITLSSLKLHTKNSTWTVPCWQAVWHVIFVTS